MLTVEIAEREGRKLHGRSSLRVVPVSGWRLRSRFLEVPEHVYADDRAWVPPLRFERRRHISAKNPFLEHATAGLWLALRGDRMVGRISAQVDHLHQKHQGTDEGFFGLLECEEDEEACAALFSVAEEWLAAQGVRRALGPFNFSINQECGLLIKGFDIPPQIMMPHGRPYYAALVERSGYEKVKDLLVYHLESPERTRAYVVRRKQGSQVTYRPLSTAHLARDLTILRALFDDAWSKNWGFVPFTDNEFAELAALLKHLVPKDFVWFAEKEGRPLGFLAALPNVNESIADLNGRLFPFGWAKLVWRLKYRPPHTARIALLGLSRGIQGTLLGARVVFGLIDAVGTAFLNHRVDDIELSWVLEDNHAVRSIIESMGAKVYKRYRIYAKELS